MNKLNYIDFDDIFIHIEKDNLKNLNFKNKYIVIGMSKARNDYWLIIELLTYKFRKSLKNYPLVNICSLELADSATKIHLKRLHFLVWPV